MFSFLKSHPFAVEAFFESSIVLTFALPKEQLRALVPECLELDTFNDKWAFLAVAMVQTKGLKPKGFPNLFGHDFFLIGYRIFVKYTNSAGKKLRGLYILKSETDKRKMELLGNIFTHYNYSTTDIQLSEQNQRKEIKSDRSGFKVIYEQEAREALLPPDSPFPDWKVARRYAGPLPFTFTNLPDSKKVLIIEGLRQNWIPQPLEVKEYHFSFLSSLALTDFRLANAFIIKDIPYHWKKGKIENRNK